MDARGKFNDADWEFDSNCADFQQYRDFFQTIYEIEKGMIAERNNLDDRLSKNDESGAIAGIANIFV